MQDKKGSHNSGVDSRESELVDGSGDASAESTPAEIPESVQGGAEGGSVPLDPKVSSLLICPNPISSGLNSEDSPTVNLVARWPWSTRSN